MNYELLTRAEAAKRARVTVRTLSVYIKSGIGPTVTRLGRRVLIRSDHLAQWIESNAH